MTIPVTARYVADAATQLGVSEKRSFLICFFIESALETRLRQISADIPYVEVDVSADKDLVQISILYKGLPYELAASEASAGQSVMIVDVDPYGRSGKAILNSFGADYCEKLDRFMMIGSLQDVEIYSFYLNINDCGAVRAYE